MNIAHRPIPEEHEQLVIISARLRTYVALGSKGDRFHLIQPAALADPRVGDGHRVVGQLVCSCEAGMYARMCWAVRMADAFEQSTEIAWLERATSTTAEHQEVSTP